MMLATTTKDDDDEERINERKRGREEGRERERSRDVELRAKSGTNTGSSLSCTPQGAHRDIAGAPFHRRASIPFVCTPFWLPVSLRPPSVIYRATHSSYALSVGVIEKKDYDNEDNARGSILNPFAIQRFSLCSPQFMLANTQPLPHRNSFNNIWKRDGVFEE